MNFWRKSFESLPNHGDIVAILLEPHKNRGSYLESAMSMEVVFGKVNVYVTNDKKSIYVDNNDELGLGCIGWYLNVDSYYWCYPSELLPLQ